MILYFRYITIERAAIPMPMRHNQVLIVLYYYHPYVSGVSVYAKRLAEGLVEMGYKVTVLTSRYESDLAKDETINGVHVVRRPVWFRLSKGVIMPTFWLDIINYARRNDVVNLHLPLADAGLSVLGIPKHKLITTYHCDINLGSGLLNWLLATISMASMRLQLARSSVVIPSTGDYLAHSKMRRFVSKAQPIYPPVAAADFYRVDPRPLFGQLGIKNKEITIGFLGRVVYEKGINYLLESIPLLAKKLTAFKIIIAGDYHKVAGGSIKAELDIYIKKYPERIIFTGYLDDIDILRFYSGLDVFVLPSIDPLEAFGMVQVEAMLCGAPVVASDLPGVREVVKKTGFGLISKARDPKSIASQIIKVVTQPKKYRPFRDDVVAHFGSQATLAAYAKLYQS